MPKQHIRRPLSGALIVMLACAAVFSDCARKPRRRGRKTSAKASGEKKKVSEPKKPVSRAKAALPGSRDVEGAIAAGEAAAVASLRRYLAAQNEFRKTDRYGKGDRVYANPKDGKGFPDLYRLPSGKEPKLIDAAMARALPDPSKDANAKAGYYFVNVTSDARGREYDCVIDHGLSAVPAKYGETGVSTFVIDVTGTILKKDSGGKPVTKHPGVDAEGWVICGM